MSNETETTIAAELKAMSVSDLKVRAKELGIAYSDVEPIEAGSNTPVKADWVRTILERQGVDQPSQQDIIRDGLARGLSNEEIAKAVRGIYPDSAVKPSHVSWTIQHERNKDRPDWFLRHRGALAEARPRVKVTVPAEDEVGVTSEDVAEAGYPADPMTA